jgi:hypothetical protein
VNRPPLGIVGFVEDAFKEGGIMTRVDLSAGSWPEEVASKVNKLQTLSVLHVSESRSLMKAESGALGRRLRTRGDLDWRQTRPLGAGQKNWPARYLLVESFDFKRLFRTFVLSLRVRRTKLLKKDSCEGGK